MNRHVVSVTAGLAALTGLTLVTICLFTGVWDGRWVAGFFLILGAVWAVAWADRPETTS